MVFESYIVQESRKSGQIDDKFDHGEVKLRLRHFVKIVREICPR
jgi:hypothetical protein